MHMELTDESRRIIVTGLLVTNNRWFDFLVKDSSGQWKEILILNMFASHTCSPYNKSQVIKHS